MQYRWNDCVNNKGNVRLGSPAVSVFPTWSNDWWTPFWNSMAADKKNAMSFIAVHSYQKRGGWVSDVYDVKDDWVLEGVY